MAARRDGLPTRVVVLSASVDSAVVFRAVANGVSAYLTKDSDRAAICDAVAAVARGQTVLAPQVQAGLAGEVRLSMDATTSAAVAAGQAGRDEMRASPTTASPGRTASARSTSDAARSMTRPPRSARASRC